MNYTNAHGPDYNKSVAAIRGMHEGADRWAVADALLAEVGVGEARRAFHNVRAAAVAAEVAPLSVSAMRQYRDAAASYPAGSRVDGVSFSAHRAALPAADPAGILGDLAATFGPKGVTVGKVKESVALANGTPLKAKGKGSATVSNASTEDIAAALAGRALSTPDDVTAALGLVGDAGLAAVIKAAETALAKRSAKANKAAAWGTAPKAPKASPAPTPKGKGKAIPKGKAKAADGPADLRGL